MKGFYIQYIIIQLYDRFSQNTNNFQTQSPSTHADFITNASYLQHHLHAFVWLGGNTDLQVSRIALLKIEKSVYVRLLFVDAVWIIVRDNISS